MPAPRTVRNGETWPPNYVEVLAWRAKKVRQFRKNPEVLAAALAYYSQPENVVDFINHWCDTYDPRLAGSGRSTRMPMILFQRQDEAVRFIMGCLANQAPGLVEKARDMGMTWICCCISVWLWLFVDGAAVGWGSRKEPLVDKIGDPDSIFEKLRILIRNLPREFLPIGFVTDKHLSYMKIVNPENGATITGESGDDIGRGGRKLIYFKDESAHYERPEKIEAALGENTNVPIDISSVNGIGNVFQRKRENGQEWEPGSPFVRDRTNVFVMDWRDHPAKDENWYMTRKKNMVNSGLGHLFAQEVDRDYASAVEGIVIRPEWVEAAVDAHRKLGIQSLGPLVAGLDVSDGGLDKNAISLRQSWVIVAARTITSRDTGDLTRQVAMDLAAYGPVEVQFDCIGVGAGVKSEVNRLEDDEEMPQGLEFVPWNASSSPDDPNEPIYPPIPDENGNLVIPPTNKNFYANKKAQAWWRTARKFERTYRAVTYGEKFEPEEMISLSSDIEELVQLKKELSQPTMGRTASSMKLIVNKTPKGTRSPNIADSLVMADNPAQQIRAFVYYIDGEEVA